MNRQNLLAGGLRAIGLTAAICTLTWIAFFTALAAPAGRVPRADGQTCDDLGEAPPAHQEYTPGVGVTYYYDRPGKTVTYTFSYTAAAVRGWDLDGGNGTAITLIRAGEVVTTAMIKTSNNQWSNWISATFDSAIVTIPGDHPSTSLCLQAGENMPVETPTATTTATGPTPTGVAGPVVSPTVTATALTTGPEVTPTPTFTQTSNVPTPAPTLKPVVLPPHPGVPTDLGSANEPGGYHIYGPLISR